MSEVAQATREEVLAAQYQSAVQAVVVMMQIVLTHDLPSILRAIEHADAVGPILDPTTWIKKHKAMHEDRQLLKAALPLWELAHKIAREREADRG